MILVKDIKGTKGLISIETKYTDLLGSNSASNTTLKDEIVEYNKIFDQELIKLIKVKGYQQIHRNYLLTYIYAKKHKFKHFANIIISPEDDHLSVKELEQLKSHLLQNKDTILKISLEEITERGINCENNDISRVMKKFKHRYIG